MFSRVAPIIKDENLCILFYKNSDVTYYKAYRVMSAIVNNNTSNFLHRYRVNFHQHFKKEFKLLEVKLMDKIFLFLQLTNPSSPTARIRSRVNRGKR